MIDLVQLERAALTGLQAAWTRPELERWRADYLGRRSALAGLLSGLGAVPPGIRPGIGRQANSLKARLAAALDARSDAIPAEVGEAAFAQMVQDVAAAHPRERGQLTHPPSPP